MEFQKGWGRQLAKKAAPRFARRRKRASRPRSVALESITVDGKAASDDAPDANTAAAFATSWNSVGEGSVYTRDQFVDWFAPVDPQSLAGASVLELGFGNGSLLRHVGDCRPRRLCGVELGDTLETTRKNLAHVPPDVLELYRGDLTKIQLGTFDFVYCIGVLHHLDDPEKGFESVVRHTAPGGRFHCWVYAKEGNGVVIHTVDPIRRAACRLPWWVTKYGVALPLALPYFVYAKAIRQAARTADDLGNRLGRRVVAALPLAQYSQWIAQREFRFFHHVAFDQLVTPQTRYISRETVEAWLRRPEIDPASVYIVRRNGNSWKFGGRRRTVD